MQSGNSPCISPTDGAESVCAVYKCSVLPEKGVVFNADLPQSLGGPVVGQLEAYGALKLFVLSGEGKE